MTGLDDAARTIAYSIDDGPGPMQKCTGYVGRVRLSSLTDGDKTLVE